MTTSPRPSIRTEADDDALDALQRDDALHEASRLVVGGLIGVAIGAGLGWIASRSVSRGSEPAARAAGRAIRLARERVTPSHAREALDDVTTAAHRAAAALDASRAEVERQVQRGLRDVRRAVRKAARRVE